MRHRRGKGRRYVADVVERVRVLIVGTTWSEAEIARRVGIGVATVQGWKVRRRWQRPQGVSVSTRKVASARPDFTRRCYEAFGRIESLAERLASAEGANALTQERARALADAARSVCCPGRQAMKLGLVRLSLRPPGGQGEPYADDVAAHARELVEGTILGQKEIAATVGVSHMTIGHWARSGNWRRPPGCVRAFHERRERAEPEPRQASGRAWKMGVDRRGRLARESSTNGVILRSGPQARVSKDARRWRARCFRARFER